MTNPFENEHGTYAVLTNAAGQRSLWPSQLDVPAGWTTSHGPDSRDACLEYVDAHWPDIRPVGPGATDNDTLSVHRRFTEQAERTPDAVAVVFGETRLTYRELDERSNRLANHLLELGVSAEDPVAVLIDRSAELIVATLAVLKAGGCYLPLHTAHPPARMQWIMDRAGLPVLLTDEAWRAKGIPRGKEVIVVDSDERWPAAPAADPGVTAHSHQLAYVMYTSGSTGEPKGVGVTHRDVLGLALDGAWEPASHERLLMLAPYAFDPSTYELWVPLLHGGRIVVAPPGDLDLNTLRRLIRDESITGLNLAAGLFRLVAEEAPDALATVREVVTGGDVVSPLAVQRVLEVNPTAVVRILYGPTEVTLAATHAPITAPFQVSARVPIGLPMEHMSVHILDEDLAPVADGETGELYVGGLGVARGYVGRPGLTAERFVADPFTGAGQRMYRTGDLGRRLPDGQIDFAGRTDDQVKIRDFRVELAEVGSALACQPGVAQVVVVPRRVEIGDTRLAAFLVPSPGGFDLAAVRAGAAATLPAYMVPTEFTVLDALPLTPNHKIDRGALLALEPTDVAPDTADEPLTADQETLCRLFAEVLGRPRVNPRDDFFDLGGQSILGLRLISRIEAEFGTQLEIADLFNAPTVAQIAELVSAASSDGEAPGAVAEPEVEDRIPLAFPQLFLNAFDQGEPTGPIGTRYHLADGWLVRGEVDVETLRDALADVVARHEALRTSVAHDENGAYQVVHPPMPALLDVVDLSGVAPDDRERRADELLIEVESREFDVRELPLVRAVLGRFDERESVLALLCHHTAVDGWSMRTLIGDLAALYAVRRGHDVSLPAPRQYREFARWQHEVAPTGLERKLEYWRETLRDAHVTVLRADHPRSAGLPPATAVHRFEIPPDVIATTGKLARSTQSSLFMVLLAAFYGMHHRLTGHADVVVPTFTPGRSEEFEKTVGSFFNFLPLRVDLTGVTTFRDILERTRNTCFRAYTNDIPTMHVFSQAPELMAPAMTDDGVAFVFQVFLIPDVMDGERIGDLKLTEMRYRLTSHPVGSDVPGALWTLNVTSTGSGIGSVQFNSNLLDEPTMNGLATEYCRLLKELVTAPDAPLSTP